MNAPRLLAFLALTLLALLLVSTAAALLPLGGYVPNFVLLLVLYLGLSGQGSQAGLVALALLIGYLTDLASGAPRGLHAVSFAVVIFAARGASNRLLVVSLWQKVVLALFASAVDALLVVSFAAPLYDGEALTALRAFPPVAIATAVVVAPFFMLLQKLDRRLLPQPNGLRVPPA